MSTKQERIEMFRDAIAFRTPKRIPMFANNSTWHLIDDGISFNDALHDWNIMFRSCCNYIERYGFDCYKSPGGRNPVRLVESMDAAEYIITDETMNAADRISIAPGEYDEYLADPKKYLWEKSFPAKAKACNTPEAWEKIKQAAIEVMAFREYNERMARAMYDAYDVPKEARFVAPTRAGFNHIMNYYRGIKQVSLDLRRNLDKVTEHARMLEAGSLETIETLCQSTEPNPNAAFDFSSGMNEQSILNRKQFEALLWPFYGKYFELLAKYDKTTTLTVQADMLRFADYFQDVKKGTVAMGHESDDAYEIRQKLPNICIMGGMTLEYLSKKTPEECVDYGKRLIDDLGRDGGFIMSTNRILTYRNDCKRENQLALNEFVRNYTLR